MDFGKLVGRGASAGLLVGMLAMPSLAQDSPNGVVLPSSASIQTRDASLLALPTAEQARSGVSVLSQADQTAPTILPDGFPAAAFPAAVEQAACNGFAGGAGGDGGDRFRGLPAVAILPRFGFFPVPPVAPGWSIDTPGYYSLWDQLHGVQLPDLPKYPYPRFGPIFKPFFDADWRYLDDPNNTEHE